MVSGLDPDIRLLGQRPERIHDYEFTEGLAVLEVFGPETPRITFDRGLDDQAIPVRKGWRFRLVSWRR